MTDKITIPLATLEKVRGYLQTQCGSRCNAEYNPCEAQELDWELCEAIANAETTGWQPISTAPKDGSFYLAFGGGKMWTQNQPNGCYPGEWYFSESRGEWRGCVISKEATHWIPLQAAPKEQQQ